MSFQNPEWTFLGSLWAGIDGRLLLLINSFSKIFFDKIELKLIIDISASSTGEGKLIYFLYFPCPPLEVGLSISTFYFVFRRVKKLI
jgi:hypothetical protein